MPLSISFFNSDYQKPPPISFLITGPNDLTKMNRCSRLFNRLFHIRNQGCRQRPGSLGSVGWRRGPGCQFDSEYILLRGAQAGAGNLHQPQAETAAASAGDDPGNSGFLSSKKILTDPFYL